MAASRPSTAVGLDTSVLLRLLVGEPRDQAERALRFVSELRAEGGKAIASDLVIAEAYFALHAHYGVPKRQAVRTLADCLRSGLVEPEPEGSALDALQASAASSQKPGFVDRLIHAQYLNTARGLVTFEKASAKLERVTVLGA